MYVDDISVTVATSVNEMENAAVKIYPNPFAEKLNITTSSNEILEFVMYDITCKTVIHEQVDGNASFMLAKLKQGLYIYELLKNNKVIHKGKLTKVE